MLWLNRFAPAQGGGQRWVEAVGTGLGQLTQALAFLLLINATFFIMKKPRDFFNQRSAFHLK